MKLRAVMMGAVIVSLATSALAQEKTIQLRLSHWVPATAPPHKAIEDWAASVEKASNGTIKSSIFPAQQLGKTNDHYDMARDGIVDMAFINSGVQPGRFPIVAAGELPFMFNQAVNGSRAIDAWYRKYAAKEMTGVKTCISFILEPVRIHSRTKLIVKPSDIKGSTFRPSQATIAAWVTLLGGTNVGGGSPTDVRDMMERGVIDATTFPWGSLVSFGVDKVAKYHTDVPLSTSIFQWIMNQKVYDGLSANQKKVIDDHCTNDWAGRFVGPWEAFESAGIKTLSPDPKREIHKPTPDEIAVWQKSGEPLFEKWAEGVRKVGGDPDVMMKELRAALDQYKASY